jgi:preprotein translocase subunit YajC
MENMWILAQADSEQAPARVESEPVESNGEATTVVPDAAPPGPPDAAPRTVAPYMNILWLVLIFGIMYVLLFRGPRKQQQQHKQMVQSLKKNDRVRTIGGIFGTVMDIKGDEVILKVDESSNTKIRVSISAINKNLSSEGKE